VIVVEWLKYTL